jgi:arsenite-transporting ATPase
MIRIEKTMVDFLREHPRLKYVFFGGKGRGWEDGDGRGHSPLVRPAGPPHPPGLTNPVHSLSGLLDQNVFGKPTPVAGVPNLWGL